MRTLVVTIAIIGATFFNSSYAKGNFSMKDKIKKVVKFDNNELPLSGEKTEFVKVSFKINEAGQLEILETNYSDETIKAQLIEKLAEIQISEEYSPEKVYNYNFTFIKL